MKGLIDLLWTFFLLSLPTVTCQLEDGYSCIRLTTETYRCKVYNYRDPRCKKWDHSQCPPPRIIRDYSHCVSYKCKRLESQKEPESDSQEEWQSPLPPVTTPTTTHQGPKKVFEEESKESDELDGASRTIPSSVDLISYQTEFDSLRAEIRTLRRVIFSHICAASKNTKNSPLLHFYF